MCYEATYATNEIQLCMCTRVCENESTLTLWVNIVKRIQPLRLLTHPLNTH